MNLSEMIASMEGDGLPPDALFPMAVVILTAMEEMFETDFTFQVVQRVALKTMETYTPQEFFTNTTDEQFQQMVIGVIKEIAVPLMLKYKLNKAIEN